MKMAETKKIQEILSKEKPFEQEKSKHLEYTTTLRDFTWKCFKNHFKICNHTVFKQTEDSLLNVAALFNYFTGYPAFFQSPRLVKSLNEPSFDKGLLIIGSYGNGKTTTMKSFESVFQKYNFSNRFKLVNSQDMVMEWETLSTQEQKQQFYQKYLCKILCIDDAKKERKGSNFGISEVVGDILIMRYNKKLTTHLTCNYAPGDQTKDLKKGLLEFARYGEHFYDRLFEMFNIIEFKGESQR